MNINRTVRVVIICVLAWTLGCMQSPVFAQAKKVTVLWEGKSAMTDAVALGFLSQMKQLAPNVEIKLYRNLKDIQEAEKIYRESEKNSDAIVFLRSSGAEFLAKEKPAIPTFVGGCNNPAELGTIQNLNAPEGKITGVTYFIPYDKRFQIIKTLFPGVKSVALLAEKGHPATPIDQQGTRDQCKALGLTYNEVIASNLKELVEGAKNLAGKVDLFIISGTRLAMDNVVSLLPIVNASNTPIFSYADRPVKSGAVVGLAAGDVKLGRMLAESLVDVLVQGKPVSAVPVKMDPSPRININKAMMGSLGLKFPDAVLKEAVIVE